MAACFALTLTGIAGAAQTQERLHLVHADIFKSSERGKLVVRELVGNVKLMQGETTILCDRAIQKPRARIYELIGHVRISDAKRTLVADKVFVYEREKKQVAFGNVVSITAKDTTRADRMTYFRDANRVLSEGSVRMVDVKRHTLVAGEVADYYRDTDFGVVRDSARLVQYDSLWTEQTRILADTLKLLDGGRTTIAVNNVSIFKKETTAACGRATYFRDADKIVLEQKPVIVQGNQRVEGDTLQLFLKNAKMTQAVMRGHAIAVSDAAKSTPERWQNKLTGQEIRFYFADEKIVKAVVSNQATSLYHIIDGDAYKGANELSGDVITVHFNQGSADQVVVRSNPDVAAGSYLPAK